MAGRACGMLMRSDTDQTVSAEKTSSARGPCPVVAARLNVCYADETGIRCDCVEYRFSILGKCSRLRGGKISATLMHRVGNCYLPRYFSNSEPQRTAKVSKGI